MPDDEGAEVGRPSRSSRGHEAAPLWFRHRVTEPDLAKNDPVEGKVVIGTFVDGRFAEEEERGPVQTEIDQLLNG